MNQEDRDMYQELSDKDNQEYIEQLEAAGTIVLEDVHASDAVVFLELYREYAIDEINQERDFLTFSEWRELNREVLS